MENIEDYLLSELKKIAKYLLENIEAIKRTPTKGFMKKISQVLKGDFIEISGGYLFKIEKKKNNRVIYIQNGCYISGEHKIKIYEEGTDCHIIGTYNDPKLKKGIKVSISKITNHP